MSLADRLRAVEPETRLAAIRALAERDTADAAELQGLAACLAEDGKAVPRAAAEALARLGRHGAPVVPLLERALEGKSRKQRWGAAFALSLAGDPPPRALPALLEALGVDDGDVRWAAAAIIARMRDRPRVIAALRGLVEGDDAVQRRMALYCLRDLGARSPDVEAAVIVALRDPAWEVRLAAVSALARLAVDRPAAADLLLAALRANDARVRRAAAAALGTLGEGSSTVVAGLEAAARSGDPSLGRACAAALDRLNRPGGTGG